ncbi:flavodoxin domain-containing protein [Clostridium sp. C2-6-12]|uniref:flavodoxin domain-containing protein n=1 Tax=Clostridium sp. C2-6-12 TaxID=2698832 RepID=UPI00136FF829|nr:flavodoxin domain-containing protein [Clostridium sp. C2-6-12]
MRSTLFISEGHYGTSKKVADILSVVLGYGKKVDISNAPEDISKYDSLVLIFSFYGNHTAEKIKKYLLARTKIINNKRIGIIGVGLCEKDIDNYALGIEKLIGKKVDVVDFVQGEINIDKLEENDKKIINVFFETNNIELIKNKGFDEKKVFEIADRFSKVLNKPIKEIGRQELFEEINKFIISNNTCALATGIGDYVRNTPIEYTYYNNNFYFISEGGFKFKGILQNSNVSITVFDKYTSMNELKGIQISGKSKIIPCWSEEYIQVINFKGLNINALRNLPVDLNLIKVVPQGFEFLNTDFKAKGMDTKQYY